MNFRKVKTMRDILFRGKQVDNGEWVYGSFIPALCELLYGDKPYGFIKPFGKTRKERLMVEVDRKTVGQYTGLTDKNGRKIFEGDIAKGNSEYFAYSHPHGIIVYDSGEFLIAFDKALEDVENLGAWANDIEVIGNIYDNPELLNGGDDNAEKIP